MPYRNSRKFHIFFSARLWNKVSEQFVGGTADEEWHEYIKDFQVMYPILFLKAVSIFLPIQNYADSDFRQSFSY